MPSAVDLGQPSPRRVPYVNLAAQIQAEREALHAALASVLDSGQHVGGSVVEAFEAAIADYCGTAHAVGLNSGTDALLLALEALGIGTGDEVITPPNSFIASTAAIVRAGATPVFADVLPDQTIDPEAVEAAITPRTRAIMPVHLTGRICDMDALSAIATRHGLAVVEDAAQAVGSLWKGRKAGALGTAGCFSAHPLKNLNACGDAGFLTTDDAALAERVRLLRNHGLADRNTVAAFGTVSRLDSLQAAVLLHRLKGLEDTIARRRHNAAAYRSGLAGLEAVWVPEERPDTRDSYHTFVIQTDARDALQAFLGQRGIGTAIHYPVPIHLQPAAAFLGHGPGSFPATEAQAARILTLPINQTLEAADVEAVLAAVHAFFASST